MLHRVGYEDAGRVRPVLHRMSLVEMAVPYGDPNYVQARKVQNPFLNKCLQFEIIKPCGHDMWYAPLLSTYAHAKRGWYLNANPSTRMLMIGLICHVIVMSLRYTDQPNLVRRCGQPAHRQQWLWLDLYDTGFARHSSPPF